MIAIISYWIKHYILLKIKRFRNKIEISKNMHALAFVYKHLGPVHMIPLTGTSRLPMISPPIYFPIKFCIVFI
jgi:hypothetical protein